MPGSRGGIVANYLVAAIVGQLLFWGFNIALLFGLLRAGLFVKSSIDKRRAETRRKRWEF